MEDNKSTLFNRATPVCCNQAHKRVPSIASSHHSVTDQKGLTDKATDDKDTGVAVEAAVEDDKPANPGSDGLSGGAIAGIVIAVLVVVVVVIVVIVLIFICRNRSSSSDEKASSEDKDTSMEEQPPAQQEDDVTPKDDTIGTEESSSA